MIKDIFDEIAAVRTAGKRGTCAGASADEGEDAEDDLDSVGADEDAEYEAFLEQLYLPFRVLLTFLYW